MGMNEVGGWGMNEVGGWGMNEVGGWGMDEVGGWGINEVGGWGTNGLGVNDEDNSLCSLDDLVHCSCSLPPVEESINQLNT